MAASAIRSQVESSTAPKTEPPPRARAIAPSTRSSSTEMVTTKAPQNSCPRRQEDRSGDRAQGAGDGDGVRGDPGPGQAGTSGADDLADDGTGVDAEHQASPAPGAEPGLAPATPAASSARVSDSSCGSTGLARRPA